MAYEPHPIDTSHVTLPDDLEDLTELLSRNVHELWARERMDNGWTVGPTRDDETKEHPNLVPYGELTDEDKEYDRITAMETVKMILALGYRIVRQ